MTMPDVTWTHPFIDTILELVPKDAKTILDVGCGRGVMGALSKIYREPDLIWGIDAFDDYLEFCRMNLPYNNLIKHDLSNGLPSLSHNFDTGICLEVIEHLEKDDGSRLLQQLPMVCRRTIVSTPAAFHNQRAFDRNEYQRHLSQWSVKDFQRLGYFAQRARPKGIWILGKSIKFVSSGLARFLSESPNQGWIVAYKDSTL